MVSNSNFSVSSAFTGAAAYLRDKNQPAASAALPRAVVKIDRALELDSGVLSIHPADASGQPVSIAQVIEAHTDHSASPPKVDFTAAVDEAYSQTTNGDCLPAWLQNKREELKNLISHGGADGELAAAELAQIDERIATGAAEQEEAGGVVPRTLDEVNKARAEKFESLVARLQSMKEEARTLPEPDPALDNSIALQELTIKAFLMEGQIPPLSAEKEKEVGALIEQLKEESATLDGGNPSVIADLRAQIQTLLESESDL